MPSEVDKRRHARHLLLPEIGLAGQARLCATEVTLEPAADPEAAAVASEYLGRAGLRVAADGGKRIPVAEDAALAALAGRPELRHAAAWLAGSLAAVEALKQVLEVGKPASLGRESLSFLAEVR